MDINRHLEENLRNLIHDRLDPYYTMRDVLDADGRIPYRKDLEIIDDFRHETFFLSNFYNSDVTLADGSTYANVEAAFQGQKCLDPEIHDRFLKGHEWGANQRSRDEGQTVPLRPDWEDIKLSVMEDAVRRKFFQSPDLGQRLLDTGNVILDEGNDWNDTTWGTVDGKGHGYLGRILMKVRDELSWLRSAGYF